MFDYKYACVTCSKAAQRRLKFRPKTHLNCIKTHIEATINQKFSRGSSPTPLTRGGIPPLVLSPNHTDFRRTTFKYVAAGLYRLSSKCKRRLISRMTRKPVFYLCKNNGADQLRGNRSADKRLCFHYLVSHSLSSFRIRIV